MDTTQKLIKKVIEDTRTAMARDGISETYIEILACTWNALLRYTEKGNTLFSEELC